jgi:hypothetical protein
MALTGSNKIQLKTTLIKAKTSLGHLQRSSLSPQAKWIATQTVVSPGITYPLMATYYNPNDLSKIENVMDQMQCSALGLNCNFPRALLHGPLCLGGMGIPATSHQITATRHNYFLYNARSQTSLSQKLDISLTMTLLEIGTFGQFLSESYHSYGHLGSLTLGTQIWRETEPLGITLRATPSATWTPSAVGVGDIPIMELAIQVYNSRGTIMINRCRLYLNVISIYDLLVYGGSKIHPSFLQREYPPSRHSTISWPSYPCPPKSYWQLWSHIIHCHVTPYCKSQSIQWFPKISATYVNIFFRHHSNFKLYKFDSGGEATE